MTGRWERRLALACAVAGVMLLFIGAALYLVEHQMTRQVSYSLIAGVALLVGYGILDPSSFTDLIRSRQARFGSLSVLVTAAVLGILVVLNILASRGSQAIDLSKAHLNTLAPQSALVAKRLDSDIQVIGFFRPSEDQSRQDAQNLLALYANENRHLKVRFENPDLNLQDVQRYGVRVSGTIVLDYKGKTEVLAPGSQTEQDVTSALLKLESDRTPQVCWAGGDGERDLKEGNQIVGYSAAADILTRNNFKTKDVLLTSAIPADCDLLAVVGAQKPLNDQETKALGDYLAGGGKLLVATDPWLDAATMSSLNAVLKPYGVGFDGALVLDPDPAHNANTATIPVATSYGLSPIARGIANQVSVFPDTTAVSSASGSDATIAPIVTTSNQAYEIASKRDNLNKTGADKSGPFNLVVSSEKAAAGGKKARLVMVGSSTFAENSVLPPQFSGVNSQLLLGSMEWLSEQENLIALPPKASREVPLALTQEQQGLIIVFTMLLLPMLVAAGGVGVWASRRFSY